MQLTQAGHGEAPAPRRGSRAFKRISGLALGVLTAVGGFVDMGGIVTSGQAGAQYRFALLWTLIPGVLGLMVFADMSGRVVIASGRTLFDVIRDRLGHRLAMIPLLSTAIVNTLTLVVELAGMSLALELASGAGYLWWFPVATLLLIAILWRASFSLLDTGSAVLGMAMLVAVAAMFRLAPPWSEIGVALVHPSMPAHGKAAYLFLTISLLGSYMTPYQFVFYSSGAVEEEWTGEDLLTNRVTSLVGSSFGAIIDFALIVIAGVVLFPAHAAVNTLADASRPITAGLGGVGLALFIVGTLGVTMGAGLETALSGAYSVCQYFGWDWGKKPRPRDAPAFHLIYLLMFVLALIIAYTHVDPIQLTVVTMAAAALALPFTFIPLLIVANDGDYMGNQKNTRGINLIAGLLVALLVVVALAAIPLFILTGGGGS